MVKTIFGMDEQRAGTKALFNMELFFELSPDLLCIAGYDGFFKKINPAVSKLLGYTSDELLTRPINDFVYFDDKQITSKVRHQLTQRKPLFNFENRYVTKSGEIVWLAWTSLPVDEDELIFAIAKNITHKKKMEVERNALLTKLTSVNRELKQFTYTTSHDLRAPVNNLLSVFNLIDLSKIEDSETLAFINILKSAGESLKTTLNGYIDALSQSSTAEKLENIDMEEALQLVLQSIKILIQNSHASVHIDFGAFATINFNKAYLESIFLNLITNSIKYARPDVPPVISIASRIHDGVRQLIVADNGLGFDMEKARDKIFGFQQRFHNHFDSKGIGLYLVHNHVTSMGGHIEVESEINEGTRFVIYFKK